jgi:hypothetical protein
MNGGRTRVSKEAVPSQFNVSVLSNYSSASGDVTDVPAVYRNI